MASIIGLVFIFVGFPMWVTAGIIDAYRPSIDSRLGRCFFVGFAMMIIGLTILLWNYSAS